MQRRSEEVKKENQTRLLKYLSENPCVDCGEPDPVVLHFDHRDPEAKEYNVSKMIGSPWERILEEIGKCDVRCANCHVRRTAKQFGWYSRLAA